MKCYGNARGDLWVLDCIGIYIWMLIFWLLIFHLFHYRLFLTGLKKFGKGDWRSISRNVVVTRTPTQVASHAQKYFLRQNSVKKERKRSSIHDITADNNPVALPVNQSWLPPPGSAVQQQQAYQPMTMPPHLPGQVSPMGYQNFGFPM